MSKVSILVSAYNVQEFIQSSIESLINQTYKNIEILIVDDGSSDETYQIIQSFNDSRIHHYSQKNKGKPATLNDLIDIAEGEFIMIHDADDISKPHRVECLLASFNNDSSLGLVMSSYCLIVDDKQLAPKPNELNIEQCKRYIDDFQMPAHDPTMMVRTTIAKECKFDVGLHLAEGYDFILRVAENYNMLVLKDILYAYRLNLQSITHQKHHKKSQYVLRAVNKARMRRGLVELSVEDFLKEPNAKPKSFDLALANHFTQSVFYLVQNDQRWEGLKLAFIGLGKIYKHYMYIKPLIYAVLPRFICHKIRGQKRVDFNR